MAVPITALYAGILGLLLLALSYLVVRNRLRARVSLGAGDDPALQRTIRAQANLTEYAPMALILMLVLEAGGASAWLLHACGAGLVVSRVLHALGLTATGSPSNGRKLGIAGTWLILLVLSVAAVVAAL